MRVSSPREVLLCDHDHLVGVHPLVLFELLRWLLLRWDQLRILELGIVAQLKTCRCSDVRK